MVELVLERPGLERVGGDLAPLAVDIDSRDGKQRRARDVAGQVRDAHAAFASGLGGADSDDHRIEQDQLAVTRPRLAVPGDVDRERPERDSDCLLYTSRCV